MDVRRLRLEACPGLLDVYYLDGTVPTPGLSDFRAELEQQAIRVHRSAERCADVARLCEPGDAAWPSPVKIKTPVGLALATLDVMPTDDPQVQSSCIGPN